MAASRFKVPHTLVLLFGMIVLAQLLTYLLPAGEYERQENEHGRQVVIADSYAPVPDAERLPPQAVFTSIPRGFTAAQDIIFFVFIVGGAFAVLRATGAIDALIAFLLSKLGGRPFWLIAGGVLLFGIGSSTIGMAEEYLPFVPVLIALCLGLGFDRVTAIGILCVGYSIGYGCAAINPFTVLIAQDVAELQPTSGLWYRLVLFVVFAAVGIHHVWSYARKVLKDPSKSLVAGIEADQHAPPTERIPFTPVHQIVLGLVGATIAVLVVGLSQWHWYLVEMGAIFLGLSVLLALIARMSADRTARVFCEGAAELTTTALLVGFARTIQIVLDDGRVVDTIIHGIAQPLGQLGSAGASVGMYFFQSLCNFFIPSGSGQAYVTMPLMAPLADLVGVGRQVAVLAYQFGDGFTNILVPTNAVLVGILGLAAIPIDRWFRFVLPFMAKVWVLGSVALMIAVWIGYV